MKQWYALYVNSRAEKKVAERLKKDGWDVFCPLKKESRQWTDRKKIVHVPYFSSYVFARFSFKDERLALLNTSGVVNILFWLGKPAIIRDSEMEEVMRFFEIYGEEGIREEPIVKGLSYEICNGYLEGKSGVVVWQNAERVTLEVAGLNMRFNVHKKCLVQQRNEIA